MTPNLVSPALEKRWAALMSVGAAVLLTSLKLTVGLLTGSLGVLAEAAHSALDLGAALLTLAAVRIADRPPDEDHPYGHGKVENLAALAEVLLLVATVVWIGYEALGRLFGAHVHVDASIWAFLVMIVSIVIDFGRSRALAHVAEAHQSPALAADALHFSTDLWSSLVVLAGLTVIKIGELSGAPGPWAKADALAALGVGLIVLLVSLRLGRQAIDALVDRSPVALASRVGELAAAVDGVAEVRRVRLRQVGPQTFADLVVAVPRVTSLHRAHQISDAVEVAVSHAGVNVEAVVHVEPTTAAEERAVDLIHYLARIRDLRAHDVRVRRIGKRLDVELHLEVDPRLTLAEAHRIATDLEDAIQEADRTFRSVTTHLEAPGAEAEPARDATFQELDLVVKVREIALRVTEVIDVTELRVYRVGLDGPPDLVVHCEFSPDLPIGQVHDLSARLERELRQHVGALAHILVHAEPAPPGLSSEADDRSTRPAP